MAINYNVNPYYDDYDEQKQFYRILFRPGRAVQARELTQIQTSLQKQIERFGKSVYKEGSIVVPGGLALDRNLAYANLTSAYASNTSDTAVTSLINDTLTGQSSGVKAIVVNYETSTTGGDPTTIYLKYTSGSRYSGGANTLFQAGELITNSTGNITLRVANTNPTGVGTQFAVTSGVLFTKGVFAYYDAQKYIVEKYSQANNAILGFEVTESTVESTGDTSLLDPAVGASNYIAPGADRYKIALDLSKRPLTVNPDDNPDFIEMVRLESGEIISKNLDPQYSILGETLARRTYDESGDYVVTPYGLSIINHLSSTNTSVNGYLTAAEGGDDNKIVNILSTGKAYVKGYEIQNYRSKYLVGTKARDYANVNNGVVSTTIGNYVYVTNLFSIPDLSLLPTVQFYNQLNSAGGTANGTLVGTGRIRGLEFYSGTPGSSTAIYKLWLFDVAMESGYTFDRDVKQLFVDNSGYSDFTCDISPTLVTLSGSVTTTNNSNVITGIATLFNSELRVNDVIDVSSVKYRVGSITNATSLIASANSTVNIGGIIPSLFTATYNETQFLSHIFEFPYSTIRNVDPTNLETNYDVSRSYARTLSSNSVTISAGTDEAFDSISTSSYALVIKSGSKAGQYLNPTSYLTRASGGTSVTVNLSSLADTPGNVTAYSTADIAVVGKLTKTNSAADKKTKTLVANTTIDFTDANTAQTAVISLSKADIYQLVSIKMSNVDFGTAYSTANEIDITDRYTLDNGQRLTYYGVGTISLKPNQPKPTNPIRVKFDYFTHGTGDFFSRNSYTDIDYDEIPTFSDNGKTYQLRDCLDFRPRINDAGTGFSGVGAVTNDFLVDDVITDYSYYLPRIDKVVLDKDGNFRYVSGVSSLSPTEPRTPEDSMALFVLKQNPYVFNINQDIETITIDNRRYTMRDIGRIENRVKNLEYYTTLNLLERETASLQIQDSAGFDRFKNGFIVDNFTGHSVGDVYNRDYGVSIDYNNRELRPLNKTVNAKLSEINSSTSARTANNYVINDGIITLPYTHVEYVKNQKASTTENINPFSIITWFGSVKLDPPSDFWYDDARQPTIRINQEGNYDQFLSEARSKGTYGAVWNNWESVYYGSTRVDTRTGVEYSVIEQIDTVTNKDVVISRSIIPKMRSVTINFTGEGLKPNTQMYVFFDNINVTNYCSLSNVTVSSNASIAFGSIQALSNTKNIVTDSTGKVKGAFTYISSVLDLTTGEKPFRLTDSPTNGSDFETLAETVFNSSGEIRQIQDQIVSIRNATLNAKDIVEQVSEDVSSSEPDPGPLPEPDAPDYLDFTYKYLFCRTPDSSGKDFWVSIATSQAQQLGYASWDDVLANAAMTDPAALDANGGIDPAVLASRVNGLAGFGGNKEAQAVYNLTKAIADGSLNANNLADARNPNGLVAQNQYHLTGVPGFADGGWSEAANRAALQVAYAAVARNSGLVTQSNQWWAADAQAALDNNLRRSPVSSEVLFGQRNCTGSGADPLAQTFFVDGSLFLTKVDLFFSAKDNAIPMKVQIRRVVNGFPSPVIVPLSEKVVYPSEITTSTDGSVATTVTFDAPVYLDAGEYALVLLADSINYRVWISQINQTDVVTGSLISEQPYIGVLFKSQNASTWTPDQYQDLKFTLYRASFSTNVTGTVEFAVNPIDYQNTILETDPFEVYPNSNIMRVYHSKHGQNTGSSIRLAGWPFTSNLANVDQSTFYGMNVSTQLNNQIFAIDNTTIDSYTITLPQNVNSNVKQILRTGGDGIKVESDHKYDTYYPAISTLRLNGTQVVHKVKTTNDVTYALDTDFITIPADNYNFNTSRTLASSTNRQVSMSNAATFIHKTELSTSSDYLSPMIDTKRASGVFARNLINNPTYNSENKVAANDIITIANANNIVITQLSGATGRITFTNTQDKINASSIIKGTYLNVSANNGVNAGQYRVLSVTDSGANVTVYNVSTQNVSTNSTATYTITNGRNFIAEESAYDGSAFSKYITRQFELTNPCTAFKFYLDVAQPVNSTTKFYYKVSEVGDTVNLKDKEYTEISNVAISSSLGGEFNEVEKLVENLPQFDAIIFKIVFLSDDSAKISRCKNLRLIALA